MNERSRAHAGVAMLCLSTGFLLSGCGGFGAKTSFVDALEDESKSWKEIAVQLPAAPLEANLLPFDVSATASMRFAVDAKSLAAGDDGVVRYTLVGVSEGGARNVSFEGIRCATQEQKLYALGRADGSWGQARRSEWEPIINNALNRAQAALAQDYVCMGKVVAGSTDAMLRRLQQRRPMSIDQIR